MERCLTVRQTGSQSSTVFNKTTNNFWRGGHDGEMKRGSSGIVPFVRICVFLRKPIDDIFQITIYNRLAKPGCVSNIGHICPVLLGQGVERANLLSSRIVDEK